MKKILALLIVLCLLGSCLVACNSTKYDDALKLIDEGNYTEAYKLLSELGDYKDAKAMLANFYYVPVSGVYTTDGEALTVEFFYNEQNLPLRTVKTDAEGGKYTIDYAYDANHDIIKETYGGLDNGEGVFVYDAERRLIKETYTDADGIVGIHEYTFDADGNCVKEVHDVPGDKTIYEFTYENGVLMTTVATYEDDLVYTSACVYDENGLLIREEFEGSDGNTGSYNYTYDEKGNMIREHDIYSSGFERVFVCTYDESGRLLTESGVYSDDDYSHEYTYEVTYDANGNAVRIAHIGHEDGTEFSDVKEVEYKLVYVPCGASDMAVGFFTLQY